MIFYVFAFKEKKYYAVFIKNKKNIIVLSLKVTKMNSLPCKIKKCPIIETVLEIRYASDFPVDAIFGVLYASIKEFFTEKPISLPILQLPEIVRKQDPNFKYQAHHKLSNENIILNIGPNVLTFMNLTPYIGWSEWSQFFYAALQKIEQTKIITNVERVGLKYINFFDENIFDKINFEAKINNSILKRESTNLRTEIFDDEFIKILQIGNAVNVKKEGKDMNGSIIDIDCLFNIDDSSDFFANCNEIIEAAHIKEKTLFFSLLKKTFLDELEPIYGEQS